MRLSQDTQFTDKTFEEIPEVATELKPDQLKLPFLPPVPDNTFCLVLDLDETLVHYQELSDGGQFLVRPYAEQFIQEMSKHYEIVIFTAALQDYADFILDIIDNNSTIKHRLYRQHTSLHEGSTVKDLSKLGRNLAKTLIIDNLPENFSIQPENGIYIQSWFGEPEDRALFELAPLLKGTPTQYPLTRNRQKAGQRRQGRLAQVQGQNARQHQQGSPGSSPQSLSGMILINFRPFINSKMQDEISL